MSAAVQPATPHAASATADMYPLQAATPASARARTAFNSTAHAHAVYARSVAADRAALTARAAPRSSSSPPRYDPRAVLARRAAEARSGSPPRYQRQLPRRVASPPRASVASNWAAAEAAAALAVSPSGGGASSAGGHDATPLAAPMERLRQWHLEARWQPPDTYASMTNTVRHKSQQTHFSRAEPLFATPPSAPVGKHAVAGLPVPQLSSLSFRPVAATAAQAYLEAQWREPGPALHASAHNDARTRALRRYFESGPVLQSADRETDPDNLAQVEAARQLALQEARSSPRRGRRVVGGRTRSPRSKKRQQQLLLLQSGAADGMHDRQLLLAAGLGQATSSSSVSASGSPDRVRSPARAAMPTRALALAEALDPLSLIGSVGRPPPPSFVTHPHNRYFRHIPKGSAREVVLDLRRERDWNTRHQLDHVVDGW